MKYYVIISSPGITGGELERFPTREVAEDRLHWILQEPNADLKLHVEEREADEEEGAGKPISGHFGTKEHRS